MADPGFPRGGGANLGGHQHTILRNIPKNCMKLKEFGPMGGRWGGGCTLPFDLPLYWEYRNIACKICIVMLDNTITTQANRF